MKSLTQYLTESKNNPLLKHEIKVNNFTPGDVVLFREIWEPGDDTAIMVVMEDNGNRVLVADVGTMSSIGSSRTLASRDLFKVGEVEVKGKILPGESIAKAFEICEAIGMDCTVGRERESKRRKL